jgi:hypothetical protein
MLFLPLNRLSMLWRRLFAGRSRPAAVTEVREAIVSAPAPAVAGFAYRLGPPAEFQLAARLASVAHLNTKAGRIPATRGKRAVNAKTIPKLQPATRKRAPTPAAKLRGSAKIEISRNAQVIAMQTPSNSRCIPLDIRIQQAA